jgi:oligosaccharide 4-alpha-D-glucosyltransferase
MKKNILCLLVSVLLMLSASAEKIRLDDSITVSFDGCEDGSIMIDAAASHGKSAAPELELHKKRAEHSFTRNRNRSLVWNSYTVIPSGTGYTLTYDGNELYTAEFEDTGRTLREYRTWKTARSFYGFGEASRTADLSGQYVSIYNESKYGDHAYLVIPFYFTDSASSVYYLAGGKDQILFQSADNPETYTSPYRRIACYVRQNKDAQEAVQNFYAASDPGCMLPRWAFGFIQSKYGYKTQQEVIDVVNGFRERKLPLDAVVLDLYWFRKMGDISWTSPSFPDPRSLDAFLESNGVKLITITEPFFTESSVNFAELKREDALCRDTSGKIQLWSDWWCLGDRQGGLFNPLSENASSFAGDRYSAMLDSGIDGFWTDLGEPEKAPASTMYGKYRETEFHNYYNLYWTKAVYDGIKARFPDKRLFFLSRSGYTGSGAYGVSVWSGDVAVSWTALSQQIAYGINAGISGLPYWGSDVGGFSQPGTKPELFVRWHEFGAFTPVYRAHGTGPREPWIFTDSETDIIRKYLEMRRSLLPYIYSAARQTMSGIPVMRPMIFEDAHAPSSCMGTQYMFGDSLLAAPVTQEGAVSRTVWLPSGTWYEAGALLGIDNSCGMIEGGREITADAPLGSIPVYAKQGAVIPLVKNGKTVLFILPAAGVKHTFTLYSDDGETEQYRQGAYAETTFTLDGMTISAAVTGRKEFAPETVTLMVPSSVPVTGDGWKENGNFKTREVPVSSLRDFSF